MAIQVVTTEQSTLFTIRTKHTTYQMKADEYGVLLHLWYGASVEGDMSYLLDYPDVGFSGNLYEAENRRTYSLNTLPLEYATEGVGDFRIPAVAATHADGSNALDLRYQSYNILKGKYAIAGLPAVYADEDEAETLEIVLKDTATDLQVTLRYGVLPELDMLTRCVSIQNLGTTPITLTKAASFCLDLPYGKWEWMHFHGRHAMERITERTPLIHGIQESSSTRGTSSHHQNPTAILCTPDCTETNGSCFGAAFLYSGSFQTAAVFGIDNIDRQIVYGAVIGAFRICSRFLIDRISINSRSVISYHWKIPAASSSDNHGVHPILCAVRHGIRLVSCRQLYCEVLRPGGECSRKGNLHRYGNPRFPGRKGCLCIEHSTDHHPQQCRKYADNLLFHVPPPSNPLSDKVSLQPE